MKLNQIENLIKLTKDNVRLLEELKQAIQRENSDYELVNFKKEDRMLLFEIKTKKLVSSGSYSFVKSWLKKRKIPINKVFTKSCWEHIISSED
jgi:hypothetical protein